MHDEIYLKLLSEKRIWYNNIKECYCPLLKQNVTFNAKGFNHLLYDGFGIPRSQQERIYRLNLVPLVLVVLRIAAYPPSKSIRKNCEYWMLQERVGKQKTLVVVILKKTGAGNLIFYSIWNK